MKKTETITREEVGTIKKGEVESILDDARKILESGDKIFAGALIKTICCYKESIEMKRDIRCIKFQMQGLRVIEGKEG